MKTLRRGFTLAELLILVVLVGVIAAITLPSANATIRQRRLISATNALVSDLEVARTLAARQRKPVRLAYDPASGEFRVTDRASGTVYHRRPLRSTAEYQLEGVSMSPGPVEIFPNGVSSGGFTISLSHGSFQRNIVVTRTGLARVVVP